MIKNGMNQTEAKKEILQMPAESIHSPPWHCEAYCSSWLEDAEGKVSNVSTENTNAINAPAPAIPAEPKLVAKPSDEVGTTTDGLLTELGRTTQTHRRHSSVLMAKAIK